MRDMVWIISVDTAVGMAASMVPPNISHAAIVRIGRTRLPPAMSEYRIASQIWRWPQSNDRGRGVQVVSSTR